ncbi:hypothetical protein SAMN02949497_1225 [Methylomagnum ishizawai]|uniref:Uncharacterized protein n=1 Tax=Methylomagnum ishizawai TaxID=1760988 RepID=A0A1Y6CTF3_9GAMM|nr:hypothetical protein [Methylomagnum ishizawai]SMF93929.1 hypothetical protein SAMN02949497_1225 [Methylomagnum ishizawai]
MAQPQAQFSDSQFLVALPGVGDFIFRRPGWGDQAQMETFVNNLVGYRVPSVGHGRMAQVAAWIEVCAVKTPKGWEGHERFPRRDSRFNAKVLELWALIEAQEAFFPPEAGCPGEAESPETGGDG